MSGTQTLFQASNRFFRIRVRLRLRVRVRRRVRLRVIFVFERPIRGLNSGDVVCDFEKVPPDQLFPSAKRY